MLVDLTVWVDLDFRWFGVFRFAREGIRTASKVGSSWLVFSHGSGAFGLRALCAVRMQVGPGQGQGGKGVAGSPNRMEQGFVMPATCGAYDESLYRANQPVPPSTPSNRSGNNGKGSNSTPDPEVSTGQQGMQGMPPFAGKGSFSMQEGSGIGPCGVQQQGNGFGTQGPCLQPPGFFQQNPNIRPQMFASGPGMPGAQMNQLFGTQFSGGTPPVMPGMPLFQGNAQPNTVLGGMTPQAQRMQQMLMMSQGLSSNQLLTVIQGLQEQSRSQGRLNPDSFGESYHGNPALAGTGVPGLEFSRDGMHNELPSGRDSVAYDAFSKSEKWLGVPPKPNFESWSTREGEVIGCSQYLIDLASWAAQASIEFSIEIQQAARWHAPILLDGLSPARRARAMRLNAILKSSLQEHARTSNLVSAFCEGVSLDESSASAAVREWL